MVSHQIHHLHPHCASSSFTSSLPRQSLLLNPSTKNVTIPLKIANLLSPSSPYQNVDPRRALTKETTRLQKKDLAATIQLLVKSLSNLIRVSQISQIQQLQAEKDTHMSPSMVSDRNLLLVREVFRLVSNRNLQQNLIQFLELLVSIIQSDPKKTFRRRLHASIYTIFRTSFPEIRNLNQSIIAMFNSMYMSDLNTETRLWISYERCWLACAQNEIVVQQKDGLPLGKRIFSNGQEALKINQINCSLPHPSPDDELEHEKSSTASGTSCHENKDINVIDSVSSEECYARSGAKNASNVKKSSLSLSRNDSPKIDETPEANVVEFHDGCFMGNLQITFHPSDVEFQNTLQATEPQQSRKRKSQNKNYRSPQIHRNRESRELYDGCFVGNLTIFFNPSDNTLINFSKKEDKINEFRPQQFQKRNSHVSWKSPNYNRQPDYKRKSYNHPHSSPYQKAREWKPYYAGPEPNQEEQTSSDIIQIPLLFLPKFPLSMNFIPPTNIQQSNIIPNNTTKSLDTLPKSESSSKNSSPLLKKNHDNRKFYDQIDNQSKIVNPVKIQEGNDHQNQKVQEENSQTNGPAQKDNKKSKSKMIDNREKNGVKKGKESKKLAEDGLKLWDMISVNNKLFNKS